jgi:hypothetical protein
MSTQMNDVSGDQSGLVRGEERDDISDLVRFGDENQIRPSEAAVAAPMP